DPVYATAGEDTGLHGRLVRSAPLEAAPDPDVLAFRVLPDAANVNFPGSTIAQRRGDSVEDAHRAEVDVLVESLPYRALEPAKADMGGNRGTTPRAQLDGVGIGQPRKAAR